MQVYATYLMQQGVVMIAFFTSRDINIVLFFYGGKPQKKEVGVTRQHKVDIAGSVPTI